MVQKSFIRDSKNIKNPFLKKVIAEPLKSPACTSIFQIIVTPSKIIPYQLEQQQKNDFGRHDSQFCSNFFHKLVLP